ncbi:bifunctional sulfate adenylyltransferase/adenylylsulfate kinase [Candidatus Rariloculus sp.]|uniref:bifunctional sulfate adenylyltransferase/adenylylsulfate kinase n=1 Tax=Candidatus Rariloculus sp. TaxID=3101265 RepID=UPI003D10DF3A
MGAFKEPHGGELKNCYVPATEVAGEKARSRDLPSWDLSMRQLCDLELLLNGAFSPLDGFLGGQDYDRVLADMRLSSGVFWPMPITLDVDERFAAPLREGDTIALRDAEGVLIATMEISSIFRPDKEREARAVFDTVDDTHPGVNYLLNRTHGVYLGGRLKGIEPPTHYDFKHLRDDPQELRDRFRKLGWRRVVAFQTRNPMHRAHQELTFRAAKEAEANLLIHPVVGMTQPGDVDHFTRVRCYEHLLAHYPEQTTMLSLLPLAMRMAGPREAAWHALIRKNFGCTHFIVGRDHAGPGAGRDGKPFYGPYDAQKLMTEYEKELDITMVPFKNVVYVEDRARYLPQDEIKDGTRTLNISGTELRRRLRDGLDIPDWFSFPDVVAELRRTHPPRHRQGFTVFFTGLSGSGKSTAANALMVKLMEMGGRPVSVLDGDVVRKHLSSELGFSKEHRDLNILRIGYVASEITKNGGIAICAPIAPYAETRRRVREMIEPHGGFIEIHVATPLEVCEQRDRKGLYAKARAGLIQGFTGISDPYEIPENPEISVDTSDLTPDLVAHRIIIKLESVGFIR